VRDFQQVVAKLRFDWALYLANVCAENDLVEFWNHLAWAECSQCATGFA